MAGRSGPPRYENQRVAGQATRFSLWNKEGLMASDHNRIKQDLSQLDAGFIRVLEDLIDALIANGSLRLTDLPPQALEKLNLRKSARQRLRDALDLIPDDDNIL